MLRQTLTLSTLAALISCLLVPAYSSELNLEHVAGKFKSFDHACFELLDCRSGKVYKFNEEQCRKRLPPQSTFKVFNSLAGLETGVLKDGNHPMKWDGQKRWRKEWNQDQTLKTAIQYSTVWYFQKVASEVGAEKMNSYIKACNYGNEDISGGITEFWIDSSLKISADEQVTFMKNLYFDTLPFSKRNIDIVKSVTQLSKTSAGELHGKTGTSGKDGKSVLGWFVGYVVHAGKPYIFATNIEASDGALGRKARSITEEILHESGLL